MSNYTLAFDVYGTLINTSGVYSSLEKMIGEKAQVFMETWRNKQLEYSFRRGLMDRHVDFSVVTKNALDYCCLSHKIDMSTGQKKALMVEYKVLPAFPDATTSIKKLREEDHRIFAFSNGSYEAVKGLLAHAGILDLFDGIVSCAEVNMFKPSPKVYRHFCEKTDAEPEHTWLISGNPFDIMGAISYGMNGAWVKRSANKVFDPWAEFQPTAEVSDLNQLPQLFS